LMRSACAAVKGNAHSKATKGKERKSFFHF